MLSTLFVIALSQATGPAAATASVDGPVVMTVSEIRTYNAKLSRDDPAYIRCERTLETGSLVKKRNSCRTNAEWRRVEEIGNQDARDLLDEIQTSGSTNRVEPSTVPAIGG
jgi:hypothetical protein